LRDGEIGGGLGSLTSLLLSCILSHGMYGIVELILLLETCCTVCQVVNDQVKRSLLMLICDAVSGNYH
jgi:hypothetical protein